MTAGQAVPGRGPVRIDGREVMARVPTTIPFSATYSVTYNVSDKFTSVAMQYDNAKAIVLAEWAKRMQNDVPGTSLALTKATQWYVAGGWRFGTPIP